MGMSVCGINPKSRRGKYFDRNVWHWGPLAALIKALFPKESAPCKSWSHNDGQGLNAKQAAALARALQKAIDNGRVRDAISRYAWKYGLELPEVKRFLAFLEDCGGFVIW